MNLQGVTVIFVIIFLPIILVSTYYIQKEVDTVTLQTSYDTKLIDATADAVSAFELNTANEDLSKMPDQLRAVLEASTNVFTTSLAANLGMSNATKNKILPHIPAIVYTLYDGYYIYSPVQMPKVLIDRNGVYVKLGDSGTSVEGDRILYKPENSAAADSNNATGIVPDISHWSPDKKADYGKLLYCKNENSDSNKENIEIECTTDPDDAYFTTQYILKSFIPYTMQYTNKGVYDVTINYTLDNYISISGTIGDIYYTKSGYLINTDNITCSINGDTNVKQYTLDQIDELVDNNYTSVKFENKNIEILSNNGSATYKDKNGKETTDNKSAIKYYIKAYIFSEWVKENLKDLSEANIQDEFKNLQNDFSIKQSGYDYEKDAKLFYTYGNKTIFTTKGVFNVESIDSNFYEHKRKVIQNSIQYNLNLAMAVYNAGQGNEYYQMPVLSETEWDKLLSNVSVLAFMQGFPCGLKTYNNYALVTSTNNEIMTNLEHIYYVPISNASDGLASSKTIKEETVLDTCHKIDCIDSSWLDEVKNSFYFESFSSKDIKYDKEFSAVDGKYIYDHVANNCYYCIVNSNYDSIMNDAIKEYRETGKIDNTNGKLKELNIAEELVKKLVKAQYIAEGKIKNDTYKSVAYNSNYGFKYVNSEKKRKVSENENNLDMNLDCVNKTNKENCFEIEITLDADVEDKNANGFLNSNPIEVFLDEEMCKSFISSDGIYTLVFNDPSKWKTGNSNSNITFNFNHNHRMESVTIKSIMFKYK